MVAVRVVAVQVVGGVVEGGAGGAVAEASQGAFCSHRRILG